MNSTKDDDSTMEVDVDMGNASEPTASTSTSKLNLSSGVMAGSNIVPSVTGIFFKFNFILK